VLKRLWVEGLAERVEPRLYVLSPDVTKKDLKAARKARKRAPS
jgi:hypothetical protein